MKEIIKITKGYLLCLIVIISLLTVSLGCVSAYKSTERLGFGRKNTIIAVSASGDRPVNITLNQKYSLSVDEKAMNQTEDIINTTSILLPFPALAAAQIMKALGLF